MSDSSAWNAAPISFLAATCSAAGTAVSSAVLCSLMTAVTAAFLACLPAVPSADSSAPRLPATRLTHGFSTASGTAILGLPACATSSATMSQISMIALWPIRMASAMTSSGSSIAPASTMVTASRVPDTTRSSELCPICSVVGLSTS